MKILMVCLGNICRSPLAEGILKHKAHLKGLEWEVDSAGTASWHEGKLPDSRSIAVAKKYGIDITDQRSRPITTEDMEIYDLIFAMDSSNYQNILKLATKPAHQEKVELIMNLVEPRNQSVPDPYRDDDGFEEVYQMLDKACEELILKMVEGRG